MSVLAVPHEKFLTGYMGKYTHGNEDTYQHFLQIVYKIAKSPKAIKIAVIIIFRKTTCFSCATNVSSQLGGSVGGLYLNSFKLSPFLNGGRVNAFTPLFEFPAGLTNLYSSITAKLRIILSKIWALNMQIVTKISMATKPKIGDTNSSICHVCSILNTF